MVAHRVQRDIESVSPETAVRLVEMELRDPRDFDEVYTALHDFARGYAFDTEREDYVIHITTGTHVAQICWVLLTEARTLPARRLQTAPPRKKAVGDSIGGYEIIDLDLTRYDRIAQRFKREQADTMSFLKSGIATRNARVNRVIERIEQVAVRSTAPVLLVGPTGAGQAENSLTDLLGAAAGRLDLFDRAQLAAVIGVCRESASLSEAGRKLFAVSRQEKKQVNDADRLRKYLARFGLDWASVSGR